MADPTKSNQQEPTSNSSPPSTMPLTWVPPGHYYSPIADPSDKHVKRILDSQPTAELPKNTGIELDEDEILEWLHRIGEHYARLPFSAEKVDPYRYYYENPAFSYGDAAVYFGMLLQLRPKRVVEIGIGHSSCLAMDTNDYFLNGGAELTFIDPYPETINRLLQESDPYRTRIIPEAVQDVDISVFGTLEANDILFIDSSHVLKIGSDVNHYLFNILPILAPGVVVHIHDIPYPFEYDADWIRRENRSWNEAYAIRAFLQYNSAFKIIYFNHFVYRRYTEALRVHLPNALRDCGASLWLQRR